MGGKAQPQPSARLPQRVAEFHKQQREPQPQPRRVTTSRLTPRRGGRQAEGWREPSPPPQGEAAGEWDTPEFDAAALEAQRRRGGGGGQSGKGAAPEEWEMAVLSTPEPAAGVAGGAGGGAAPLTPSPSKSRGRSAVNTPVIGTPEEERQKAEAKAQAAEAEALMRLAREAAAEAEAAREERKERDRARCEPPSGLSTFDAPHALRTKAVLHLMMSPQSVRRAAWRLGDRNCLC